jgi:peptidoglycan/LPS O-acetylase OafA/YrhL
MDGTRFRIPALDGFRAISIGLVMVSHVFGTPPVPTSPYAGIIGKTGVKAFFVISGFLITTLLLRERAGSGRISLGSFYARRAFRIFPPFYSYLAVIVVLVGAGALVISIRDLLASAFYAMNFIVDQSFYVGHAWSLAVEEQFYLLWPITLVLLGTRRATWIAMAAILLAPIMRVAAVKLSPNGVGPLTDQAFPFVFDALATGCVLAILRPELERSQPYNALLDSRWFWFVPLVCIGSVLINRWWFQLGASESLANLGIALAIHRCITRTSHLATRVLEHPALVWVGTLSYSLYLWQEPFLNRHAHAWWCTFPANVAFAFAAATLSYYLIEKPVLRAGRRWMSNRATAP